VEQAIEFDLALIKRYDKAGPRYTSYPTALEFDEKFTDISYQEQITISNERGGPLSLYFHLPFCDTVCFYCACNKIITKNRKHAIPYLENLHKEIAMQAALFDKDRVVEQLHWGGGTPTFISHEQMRQLMQVTREHFTLADDERGEFSIEVDPREADAETIAVLREIGFNRISLGVQDFNPVVQKAVNRIQSEEETLAVINAAREQGFRSISLDLIYGLPYQTPESFAETLDKIIDVAPDRISVFNYAHLPSRFKVQRQMDEATLPSAETKMNILQQSIKQLTEAGYVYIGMDHFAKPDDELTIAQKENKLYRNFQGYSTHSECDLIGLGITSIGSVGDSYAQNYRTLEEYADSIESGQLAISKGVTLTTDDKIRKAVITRLICHFELDFSTIEQEFDIKFDDYFADELAALMPFVMDKLVYISEGLITVNPAGRLLIRNICMVFDRYMQEKTGNNFLKVI
jgi:oxygen-independent coproporphyrinogen-3 oxidase